MSNNNDAPEIPSPPPGERVRVRGQPRQFGKHRTRTSAACEFARHLRQDATDAEKRLWRLLRDRRFSQFKFRRQYPCGIYFLDFYARSPSWPSSWTVAGTVFPTGEQWTRNETNS